MSETGCTPTADITEDIGMVDERLGDGIQVDGALTLLSGSYGRLADAGAPPGLDRAQYLARVTTLAALAGQSGVLLGMVILTHQANH